MTDKFIEYNNQGTQVSWGSATIDMQRVKSDKTLALQIIYK